MLAQAARRPRCSFCNRGNDILIGGGDRDWLFGGFGSDLLTGNIFDADPDDDADPTSNFLNDMAFLREAANEWTSGKPLSERSGNITGDDPQPDRLNDDFFLRLGGTLFDDGSRDALFGDSLDLFLPRGRDRVIR